MKPYGRIRNIKGSGIWKNGNRQYSWWHDMAEPVDRGRINQIVRKEVLENIHEQNKYNILPYNISFHL